MHAWTTVVAVAHIQRREGGGHVLFNRRPRNRVGRRFCRARVGGAPGVARNAEARVFHRALFGHGYEFDFGAPRVVRAGTRRAFGDAREELRVARYLRPQRARQRFTRVGDPAFAMRRELDEFRFARRFFAQLFGVRVAVPAVAGVLRVGELGQVDVARVAEEAVVFERVVGDFVAQVVVVAEFFVDFRATEAVVFLKARGRGFFNGRVGDQQDSPGAVVVDRVPADDVVVVAGEHHTAPDRPSSCYAGGGDVGVVVVVHEVFREQPAVVRAGRPRFAFFRARTVLRRGRVVVVLAVADEARLVVVELRVLDRQVPARVRARVAERAGFGVGVVEDRVAVATGADVEVGVRHVVGVDLRVQTGPARVGDEEPVGAEVGRAFLVELISRREECASPGAGHLFSGAVAEVEPDLVPAAALACLEVAHRQVLDAHALDLEHLDPVAPAVVTFGVFAPQFLVGGVAAARRGAFFGAVDDYPVAVHPADVDAGLFNQHPGPGLAGRRAGGQAVAGFLVVA